MRGITIDEFKKEIEELGNGEYELVEGEDTYKNKRSRVVLKHLVCGYLWETNRDNFVNRGNRCKKCAKQVSWTKKTLQEFLNKKFNGQYDIVQKDLDDDSIIQVKDYIEIYNRKCSHSYSILVSILLHRDKHNCKVCGKNRRIRTSDFVEEVKTSVGDEYTVLSDYHTTHELIKMKHNICGNIYSVSRTNFLGSPNQKGRRCPFCCNSRSYSNSEREVSAFIKTFYKDEIQENNRKILPNNKELDLYLPNKKVAIEFDGLYFHSENFNKDKKYHLNKTLLCEEQGIRLIHIFGDEWQYKQDIVKSKIKHILHCDNNPVVYARKCYVEEISAKDKNQFLEENHIQGKDNASIRLGLWYPTGEYDELVAVMTFCKPRKALGQKSDSKYDYELSRFASNIDYRVIGAFGKLWKYFENHYEFNSIITYADRRWSIGNVYETNGFELDHVSKPNYWYFKESIANQREYRYKYRKSKLKELFPKTYREGLSEYEIMQMNGYTRIWDCGNLVYKYTK